MGYNKYLSSFLILCFFFLNCKETDQVEDIAKSEPQIYIGVDGDIRQLNDVGLKSIELYRSIFSGTNESPDGIRFVLSVTDPEKKVIGDIGSFINNELELIVTVYPKESPSFIQTKSFLTLDESQLINEGNFEKKQLRNGKAIVYLIIKASGNKTIFCEYANSNQAIGIDYSNGRFTLTLKDILIKNVKVSARLIIIGPEFKPVIPPVIQKVKDIDGNEYNVVTIGNQVWMAENLKVKNYNNGNQISTTNFKSNISNESNPKYYWLYDFDVLPIQNQKNELQKIVDNGGGSLTLKQLEQGKVITSAQFASYVKTGESMGLTSTQINSMTVSSLLSLYDSYISQLQTEKGIFRNYGAVYYTWNTVTDTRKICPVGWHVPTATEWQTLINYLGGSNLAGGKMKFNSVWKSPNSGANDNSVFKALPFGLRKPDGSEIVIGETTGFWTATSSSSTNSQFVELYHNNQTAKLLNASKNTGYCVRCIQD